ncbi:hypothetical protein [Elioraea sp.]|uniref:hypothetical protein n=1 Tax=Elioraea sp. TaxID=2185103 RepID=UPI0021DCFCCD|nr:hypothetical protein [Elioraea sp.]GIX09064.1 MAG: hypothetical protein KatS3mg116_0774 [Elioraea sp.]
MITACEVRAVSEAALIAALRTEPKPGERMVLVGMPMGLVIEPQPPLPPRPAKPTVPVRPPAPRQPRAGGSREVLYQLRGMVDVAPTAKDAFLTILRTLAAKDGTFWAHLAPLVAGRNVNHIARSPAEVHPHRPDLRGETAEIARGWFANTNISNQQKERILRAACEAAGIVFGRDLRIELPNA